MSSGHIRLHPRHGLNPTLGVCFWCGEQNGEVALLGAAYHGEAPHQMVVSFEPCNKCKTTMGMGITIIECTQYKRDDWQVAMQDKAFPTGRWCVVKRESEFIQGLKEPMRELVLRQGVTFMEPETYERLGLHKPQLDIAADAAPAPEEV